MKQLNILKLFFKNNGPEIDFDIISDDTQIKIRV